MIKVSLIIIFAFFSMFSYSQQLEVKIQNIDASKGGKLLLGIFNNEDAFLKVEKSVRKSSINVIKKIHTVTYDSLPAGNYAISVFHDENLNNELDANIFFFPKEGYGFSTNPKLYGPPKWSKTNFYYDGKIASVDIFIVY